jgi:hypothetical protein
LLQEKQNVIDGLERELASRPNPNLLDNWYFGNPVDQRGGYVVPPGTMYWTTGDISDASQSVGITDKYYPVTFEATDYGRRAKFYIGETPYYVWDQTAVRGYCELGYTIDRWRANGGMSIVLTDSGLLLTANGVYEYGYLAEYLETLPPLGATVTLSALVDGQLYSASRKLTGNNYITINLPDSNQIMFDEANKRVYPMVYPDHPYTISAIKLELGSQQTLAHQDENGNWVLNEIPDYGEQLRKCQRYYYKLYPNSGDFFIGFEDDTILAYVQFPVPMRTRPACVVHPLIIWNQFGHIDAQNASFLRYPTTAISDVHGVAFYIATGTTDVVADRIYVLDTPSAIEFSADL